jgi:hypothetical protein
MQSLREPQYEKKPVCAFINVRTGKKPHAGSRGYSLLRVFTRRSSRVCRTWQLLRKKFLAEEALW